MTAPRPNVIFIITDQQRYDTIGALGFPYMDTPVLDRLVREGTTFTQCHTAGASCAPARAALFTGFYPHTNGILGNGQQWRHTWIENFQAAGYRTINIGKMHTDPMDTPAGFDERYNVENKARYKARESNPNYADRWDMVLAAHGVERPTRLTYSKWPDYFERLGAYEWPLEKHLHPDVFTADLATWWLRRNHPVQQPLFLQVGFPGPHPPYDPWVEETTAYMDKELPLLPVSQAEMDAQPPAVQHVRKVHMEAEADATPFDPHASPAQRKRQRAYYLANQTMIDRKIGEILALLKEQGYLDNAVVVFTSDHGDCLGDHGLNQKWTCYEQITRMPLMLWGPGRVPAGHTVDALVQQQDLVPWLFEVAGLSVPQSMEVESLAPALNGSAFAGREAVYCEQGKDRFLVEDFMTMVRTRDWKLVHYLNTAQGQLFDLKNDPLELKDLWNDDGTRTVRRELEERMMLWRLNSQLQTSEWMREFR